MVGLVHILIGALALSIAAGAGGDADQSGAMEQIRQTPVGGLLLSGMAVGLGSLALWRITGTLVNQDPHEVRRWATRVKSLSIAVAYLAMGTLATVYAVGGRADSERTSQTVADTAMALPGGALLVAVVGVIVATVGGGFVVSAITRSFVRQLALPSDGRRAGIVIFGVLGYLAKGVALAATGVFFVVAAVTQDPGKAGGLDGALHQLATSPWGRPGLWAVAVGLIVYGLFCLARARYARM